MTGEPTCEALWATPGEDAFSALFRRHEGLGVTMARKFARTPQDAEDIAQEAWLRLFRRRAAGGHVASFRRLLAAAVIFGARRHTETSPAVEHEEISEALADPTENPEASASFQQAINRMDDSPRRVFGLVIDQGHSVEEAAEVEGVSRRTAYRRLGEAMETLEQALGRAA